MRAFLILTITLLSGCVTCEERPVLCAAGAALATGILVAAATSRDARHEPGRVTILPVNCANGACQ